MDRPRSTRHRVEKTRPNRGLTCANCRARKTRCDGSQPSCKTCEVYNDECRYERAPPMSQILAMAKRLEEAESAKAELEAILARQNASSTSGHVARAAAAPPREPDEPTPSSPSMSTASDAQIVSDLSLDENGKLCYHGPTSAVHAPLSLRDHASPAGSTADMRMALTSSAMEARLWEDFAIGNATLQTLIPQQVVSKLLQIHWTWIAPMFMWVYRPAFMRDMAMAGPYYSPFLLTVLCAHAARFDDVKLSELLVSRARLLLGNEIHRPSSIPTVQALLQLSARDLAYGSVSQSWLYSGMAFRMVSDLGLHHSAEQAVRAGGMTAEEVEIRKRLFWSCYFWDKAVSLYLGRTPVLQDLPADLAPEFLDDSAEHEPWSPHCGTLNFSRVAPSEYPSSKAHLISCFQNSCKLSVILNEIILAFYSRHSKPTSDRTLESIRARLTSWREETPLHLRLNPDSLPDMSPPPHILTQNLLYYTTVILLHRPFSTHAHHITCRKASDSIEKLLALLEKTFGFNRVTYLMSYCIYTGASVITQDARAGDLEATRRMQTFLRALTQGIATCPILQRSLDIITKEYRSSTTLAAASKAVAEAPARSYLPAFPYRDTDMGETLGQTSIDLDGFSFLDSFPETLFDGAPTAEDWFLPP